MDRQRLYLLQKHRAAIVKDLNVEDVITDLLSTEAVTDKDYTMIMSETDRTKRVSVLLDTISKKDDIAYDLFAESLTKYYRFLWEKLQFDEDYVFPNIEEDFNEILSRGDVPKLPTHYVPRKLLEKDLQADFSQLKRYEVLVLHGMPGSGKSTLVASTLRNDPSIRINFSNHIFWMNVADCFTDEQIVQLQLRLLRKTSSKIDQSLDSSRTSLSSARSSHLSYLCDQTWEDFREMLKATFERGDLKNAILIIDDLKIENVMKAFSFGCKLVITTQDLSWAQERSFKHREVLDKLSEEESLQLISKCVNIDMNKLPSQAKKMYKICKGNPLIMSMLGGILEENKESLQHDESRWNHYLNQLQDKTTFLKKRFKIGINKNLNYPFKAVEMCIDSMKEPTLQDAYRSLVVVDDNVKVSTEAMAMILNTETLKMEIGDFMKLLKSKSLIMEHYNIDLKTYQYEVPDLMIAYLKDYFHEKKDDIKMMHNELLERYKIKYTNLINLPQDDYIGHQIGHHILNADTQLFNSLYTNLEFIGNKIRLTGPISTMNDLNKYTKYIKVEEIDSIFLGKLGEFITKHGHDLYHYKETDIIQSILQHESDGLLYEKALQFAHQKENSDHLYLLFNNDKNADENFSRILLDENPTIVCFWQHYVFVGNQSGRIALINIVSFDKIATFEKHVRRIKSISISCESPYRMASTCDDGTLHLWSINHFYDIIEIENEDEIDGYSHEYYCSPDVSLTHDLGAFCDVTWGKQTNILLTHVNPTNKAFIYNDEGVLSKTFVINEKDSIISCSILSRDDSLVIIGYDLNRTNHGIHFFCATSCNLLMVLNQSEPILKIALIPNNSKSILILTKKYVEAYKWKYTPHLSSINHGNNIETLRRIHHDDMNFHNEGFLLTIAINEQHSWVFIATSDYRILVYDLQSGNHLWEFHNQRGPVITMDWTRHIDGDLNLDLQFLLTASGADELSLKLWPIDEKNVALEKSRKIPEFHCVYKSPLSHKSKYKMNPESPVRRADTISYKDKNYKIIVNKTPSLDRQSLRPLSLNKINNREFIIPVIAVADSSNCVQVFKDRNLIAKTNKASSTIGSIVLSPCGSHIIYGLENGAIFEYSLKLKTENLIMSMSEPVSYITYLNPDVLVAAGKESGLMICEISEKTWNPKMIQSESHLGSQELLDRMSRPRYNSDTNGVHQNGYSSPNSNSSINSQSPRLLQELKRPPVIKCFIKKNNILLTISLDGSVVLWSYESKEPKLLGVLIGKQNEISCACMEKDYLILCDKNGGFKIYEIVDSDCPIQMKANNITSKNVNKSITCCSMTNDNKILALGCECGDILLWHVLDKEYVYKIHFHPSPIKCLKFSPVPSDFIIPDVKSSPSVSNGLNKDLPDNKFVPLVLVSVAGQIAWWNVSYMYTIYRKNKKPIRPRSQNLLSPIAKLISENALQENSSRNVNDIDNLDTAFVFPCKLEWENLWRGKSCNRNIKRKDLIGCIKLTGNMAMNIIIDENFSSFITVDQGGILYIMNVLKNN